MRFDKPALFIRGTKSKYVPDEVLPTIGQFFPRFEVVDIEAGHWVTAEKPEEFRQGEFEWLCHFPRWFVLMWLLAVVKFLGSQE